LQPGIVIVEEMSVLIMILKNT